MQYRGIWLREGSLSKTIPWVFSGIPFFVPKSYHRYLQQNIFPENTSRLSAKLTVHNRLHKDHPSPPSLLCALGPVQVLLPAKISCVAALLSDISAGTPILISGEAKRPQASTRTDSGAVNRLYKLTGRKLLARFSFPRTWGQQKEKFFLVSI